jgi:predicted acylesterase/phospholipase RssA
MTRPKRRSLLLAGGGLKVAFQAGVLQVLLSEVEGLKFDHVDACSGGAFNLAMLCNGWSGLEIADAWRRTKPFDGVSGRWQDVVRIPWGERSIVTMDAYRKVFRKWGLHWNVIRSSTLDATFTVHNRTLGQREMFTPAEMDEDRLVACLSQAVWFPPVEIDGTLYSDAVFDTDANVDVAIDKDADEIWVIWTVSRQPEWMPGLMAQFFHALEESANGTLTSDLARIEKSNTDLEAGRHSAIDHHVTVRVIKAEVPVHYLVLLGQDRLHRAVEQGVTAARRWCDEPAKGEAPIPYTPIDRGDYYNSAVTLTFVDHLNGTVTGKELDAEEMDANLQLIVEDAGEFVSAGRQRARLGGTVTCALVGGPATVVGGYADIFLAEGDDPSRKRMEYVVHLKTPTTDRLMTLTGLKTIESRKLGRAVWESMTMRVRLLEGHVAFDDVGPVVGQGILFMSYRDVAKQLRAAKADGPHKLAELAGKARYGAFFAGNLWDVAARKWLTYAPF